MRYFADNRFLEYDNRKAVWETVSALPGGAPQQPPQTPIWFIPLTPKGNNAPGTWVPAPPPVPRIRFP